MKRFIGFLMVLVAAVIFTAPAAQAEVRDYWAYVYSWDGKMNVDGTPVLTRLTSGVTFKVLRKDADTSETLTYYQKTTSLTNPVSTTNFASNTVCNDMVAFSTDPTDSGDMLVDLIVVNTAGGFTAFVEDFSPTTHTIIIDQRPGIMHHGMIWFGASDNAETDTGVDFLYDTYLHDVMVEVVTVDATETIDVGLLSTETSGDANGLRAAVDVATAGYIKDTAVITSGTNADYWTASTYGALLVTAITGADTNVTTLGGKSWLGHVIHTANAKSLTYTGSAGSDTAAGYIHYFFTRTR